MELELTLPSMKRMTERISQLSKDGNLTEDECHKMIEFLHEIKKQIEKDIKSLPDGCPMITECMYSELLLMLRISEILESNAA